jgi:DNA polymerase-3 subunit epsilon
MLAAQMGSDAAQPAPADPAAALAAFAGDPARLLRSVRLVEGRVAEPDGPTSVAVILDTETTGLDFDGDVVIEMAMRRIRFDASGRIVEIGRGQSWLEDPRRALDPKVTALTGITDNDVRGQRIDTGMATGIIRSADWICAHNGGFDRRFVERRLPLTAGSKWCCSCVDVDWRGRGLDGRGLGWLLSQLGLCHSGHRALNDVDAVVALLASEHGGRTALAEMVENAASPAWLVSAVGASFGVKDTLRLRGYRWNRTPRLWQREVPDRERQSEEFWLARCVYAPDANPQALGPRFEPVDPATRFL